MISPPLGASSRTGTSIGSGLAPASYSISLVGVPAPRPSPGREREKFSAAGGRCFRAGAVAAGLPNSQTRSKYDEGNLTNLPENDGAVIYAACHDATDVTAKSDVEAGLENVDVEAVDQRASLAVSEPSTQARRVTPAVRRRYSMMPGGDVTIEPGGGAALGVQRIHRHAVSRGERTGGKALFFATICHYLQHGEFTSDSIRAGRV
jgi:hypothetical protein